MGNIALEMGSAILPAHLWINVLKFLPAPDLGRALCVNKTLYSTSQEAWKASTFRKWPKWALIAAEPRTQWRRVYELLALREAESNCIPDVNAIKTQTVISDRHRGILAEWLSEVALDWGLESTMVFKAVLYLDNYLSKRNVERLGRFQLVGIACLRAAIGDASPLVLEAKEKVLDPKRFSHISDDAYTPEEVEAFTKAVIEVLPSSLKKAPISKMFLRSFWYRVTLYEIATCDEMHIYTLASFLLQLSLLDLECSRYPGSLVAAGALSLALKTFNKPIWPTELQQFGSYELADVQPCMQQVAEVQATQQASQLRRMWRANYESNAYEDYKAEWKWVYRAFTSPCQLVPMPPTQLSEVDDPMVLG